MQKDWTWAYESRGKRATRRPTLNVAPAEKYLDIRMERTMKESRKCLFRSVIFFRKKEKTNNMRTAQSQVTPIFVV